MTLLINFLCFIAAFLFMEFAAWFTHKYVMHGLMWRFHYDHHNKNPKSFFEWNDIFFIIFAVPSILLIASGIFQGFTQFKPWIGFGIMAYGFCYFLVHDVFIHQRFKFLAGVDNHYLKALRRAHRVHHRCTDKEGAECFGMLWVPVKYWSFFKRSN